MIINKDILIRKINICFITGSSIDKDILALCEWMEYTFNKMYTAKKINGDIHYIRKDGLILFKHSEDNYWYVNSKIYKSIGDIFETAGYKHIDIKLYIKIIEHYIINKYCKSEIKYTETIILFNE